MSSKLERSEQFHEFAHKTPEIFFGERPCRVTLSQKCPSCCGASGAGSLHVAGSSPHYQAEGKGGTCLNTTGHFVERDHPEPDAEPEEE